MEFNDAVNNSKPTDIALSGDLTSCDTYLTKSLFRASSIYIKIKIEIKEKIVENNNNNQ